jgi:hypothetical protein
MSNISSILREEGMDVTVDGCGGVAAMIPKERVIVVINELVHVVLARK